MAKKKHSLELAPEHLTRHCNIEAFPFKDTSELAPERTIYGQPRGVRAIEFGIDIQSQGYNIYVLGPSGSGRVSAIRQFINERAIHSPTPDDWCYVYNFKQTYKPRSLRLAAGQGKKLKSDMETMIHALRAEIPRALDGEPYRKARNQITNQFEDQRQQIIATVQAMAAQMSFALQTTPQGVLIIVPTAEGEPLKQEDYEKLSESERAAINEKRHQLEEAVEEAFRATRLLQNETENALNNLRRAVAEQVIDAHMRHLIEGYRSNDAVLSYLQDVRADILDSLDHFESEAEPAESEEQTAELPLRPPRDDPFVRYEVNVLVEHEPDSGAPVIFLDLPTYRNLVGRIEHEVRFGVMSTNFTLIKSGALHRANSGFLVMRATDILQQPFAWEALKRALNTGQVVIEDAQSSGMTVMATQTLEPEPIPIDLRVVLIGSQDMYYALYAFEDDFRDLFRVKADFGDTMTRDAEAELHYASFIATRCHEEKLPHFSAQAVGRVIEYGSWLVSDQRKLTTQFGQIELLVREAAFFAKKNKHKLVTLADVEEAIRERTYRNNEAEELSLERIIDGTIFIDLSGEVVGQVNGLVVITLGDHTFGLPSRITARVYMGREGIVHIDRESEMTGPIHDKGVMTMQGYLGGHYAQDYPLSLSATLAFEQNYGGVEGDSASSTELYALLSVLSGFPIKQDLAVTGSVNQRGQVQPIGGVTQKVEGFFNVCKMKGLTGTQGVIIPKTNVPELMLNEEVIKAVKKGDFHIYAVETVDEGIAILTGKSAEEVHQAVDARLRDLAEKNARWEDSVKGDDPPEEG